MATQSGRVLYEAPNVTANGHGHQLRVVEVDFADGPAIYVDVTEPGKCGCVRRIALSELVHLLVNIDERELLTIPNRDRDPAGHEHPIAPSARPLIPWPHDPSRSPACHPVSPVACGGEHAGEGQTEAATTEAIDEAPPR